MAVIAAFGVALVGVPVTAFVANRVGFLDRPGPLKGHEHPVAYGGGVAVFVALVIPLARVRPTLLLPLALACALGLLDDTRDLPVAIRIVSEVVIGFVAAWVVAPHTVPYTTFAVLLVVVLLNAANLLDGLDGLLAVAAALGALGFAVVLGGAPADLALALAGALAAFLVWNRPPARIYLGDAGSYLTGTTLAMLCVAATRGDVAHAAAAPLFVAVPVADTVIAIVRRVRARRPVLKGDRGHVYDQLVDQGWSVPRVLIVCATAQFTFTALGILVASVADTAAVTITSVTVAAVGVAALWRFTAPRTWVTDV